MFCIGLYLVSAAAYLAVVSAANRQQLLTGEEASVSFVDVVAVGQRFQFTHFSTNFGGHLIFWIASHIDTSIDLFYGRRVKALVMALIAPLMYCVLHRRLACSRSASVLGAIAGVLMPGVVAFSWLATENGLEAVAGLMAMLLATSRRRFWWTAPLVAGISVSIYGAGLAWASGVMAITAVRLVLGGDRDRGAAAGAFAAAATGLAVVFFPLYWWHGGAIVSGGGHADLAVSWTAIGELTKELSIRGGSYYYFTTHPALSSVPMALGACIGLALMARRRFGWPWLVVLAISIALYLASGDQFPGVRRTIAVVLIASMGLGVAADSLARMVSRLTMVSSRRFVASTTVHVVGFCLVLLPIVIQAQVFRRELATSAQPLPTDFGFRLDPGISMPRQLERVADALRNGQSWKELGTSFEPTRTAAIIYMLSRSGALPDVPISGTDVKNLYRESNRCEMECRSRQTGAGPVGHTFSTSGR